MLYCCVHAQVFKEGALKRGINCIYIVCKPGDEVRLATLHHIFKSLDDINYVFFLLLF